MLEVKNIFKEIAENVIPLSENELWSQAKLFTSH